MCRAREDFCVDGTWSSDRKPSSSGRFIRAAISILLKLFSLVMIMIITRVPFCVCFCVPYTSGSRIHITINIRVVTVVPLLPAGKLHCFRGPHCLQQPRRRRRRRRRRCCTPVLQCTTLQRGGWPRPGLVRPPTWATMYSAATTTHQCSFSDTIVFSRPRYSNICLSLNVDPSRKLRLPQL